MKSDENTILPNIRMHRLIVPSKCKGIEGTPIRVAQVRLPLNIRTKSADVDIKDLSFVRKQESVTIVAGGKNPTNSLVHSKSDYGGLSVSLYHETETSHGPLYDVERGERVFEDETADGRRRFHCYRSVEGGAVKLKETYKLNRDDPPHHALLYSPHEMKIDAKDIDYISKPPLAKSPQVIDICWEYCCSVILKAPLKARGLDDNLKKDSLERMLDIILMETDDAKDAEAVTTVISYLNEFSHKSFSQIPHFAKEYFPIIRGLIMERAWCSDSPQESIECFHIVNELDEATILSETSKVLEYHNT